jgi:hypothetical protein
LISSETACDRLRGGIDTRYRLPQIASIEERLARWLLMAQDRLGGGPAYS